MAAHRYWRIYISDTKDAGVALIEAVIAEIELRTSIGGADATGLGVAIQSVGTGSNAFDNSTTTDWDSGLGNALPQWVGYDFGAGNDADIVEILITASSGSPGGAPRTFNIEYSDDGSAWTIAESFSNEPDWAASESRTYAIAPPVGAALAVDAAGQATGTGALTTQISLTGDAVGVADAVGELQNKGIFSLPVRHTLITNTGIFSLPVRHRVVTQGIFSLPIRHVVQAASQGNTWQLVVMLNGVDISAQITGSANIEANKGAARLANFILKPLSGPINAQEWVKKPVTIDYVTLTDGVVQTSHRRYTGFVNDATYDPETGLTTVECSDNLQDNFEGKAFSFVDGLIGGYYSDAIFNETDNGWEYAQQRLESQPNSYDKDVNGAGRKWAWLPKTTADLTYTQTNILSESLSVTQNTARDIVNKIEIKFQYRTPRRWQREMNIGWVYPFSIAAYLSNPTTIPTRDMFLNSLPGDWWVKSLYFTKMPTTGTYLNLSSDPTGFFISEELRNSLIWGVSGIISRRWLQDTVEEYTLTVKNQASIDEFGEVVAKETYSLDSLDDGEFEQIATSGIVNTAASSGSDTYKSPEYQAPLAGSTKFNDSDYYLDSTDRTAVDNATITALNIASTDILASHIANEVGFEGVIDPLLDIGVTVDISTTKLSAKGTVGFLKEVFNFDSGVAQFEAAINVYAPNVAGQATSALNAPNLPDLTPADDDVSIPLGTYMGNVDGNDPVATWTGYLGNFTYGNPNSQNAVDIENTPAGLVMYPIEFRTTVPAVTDDNRLEKTFTATQTYNVAIPQETLTISA